MELIEYAEVKGLSKILQFTSMGKKVASAMQKDPCHCPSSTFQSVMHTSKYCFNYKMKHNSEEVEIL